MGHLINVYRSTFNWNLPMVTQQAVTEWVCPPSLGCSGNNLWRILSIPSMRTGREIEKSKVWESTTGPMMSATDGEPGRGPGPLLIHWLPELRGPFEIWSIGFRRMEIEAQAGSSWPKASQVVAGPTTALSTPPLKPRALSNSKARITAGGFL